MGVRTCDWHPVCVVSRILKHFYRRSLSRGAFTYCLSVLEPQNTTSCREAQRGIRIMQVTVEGNTETENAPFNAKLQFQNQILELTQYNDYIRSDCEYFCIFPLLIFTTLGSINCSFLFLCYGKFGKAVICTKCVKNFLSDLDSMIIIPSTSS